VVSDTIAAISTPPGEGGIGIVRISGKDSFKIIDKFFLGKTKKCWDNVPSHTMHLGVIVDEDGKIIDEVLLSIMKGPRTFTGEDVVEINCHGGYMVIRKILEITIRAGARLAERGEFSKRAFLNGKIDLSQAEAIIDVIRAKSDTGLQVAVKQLRGSLKEKIQTLRNELLRLLAAIEAAIDFPEEDLEEVTQEEIKLVVNSVLNDVGELIKSSDRGRYLREGIKTAIIGRTNVGKSSLLNALLGENRAIVTEIPGTTRDTIEEFINVRGFPLKIVDTAGIRETQDLVEKIGVAKTKELIETADLVLFVVDVVSGFTSEDEAILEKIKGTKAIVLINKIDIGAGKISRELVEKTLGDIPYMYVSAKEEIGLEELEQMIEKMVSAGEVYSSGEEIITNMRQKESLMNTNRHLKEVLEGWDQGMSLDFLSIDLKAAWEALGEVTGENAGEELIDRIFSDFCIGK